VHKGTVVTFEYYYFMCTTVCCARWTWKLNSLVKKTDEGKQQTMLCEVL